MRKSEILAELPKLNSEDRRDIFERLREMEERDLLNDVATRSEKALLDREWDDYQKNSQAGSTWEEVAARIRKSNRS